MSKSISKRIFVITFGIISVLMISAIIFQTFFFEDFYVNRKSKLLINSLEDFKKQYSYKITTRNSLNNALFVFGYDNNAKAGVYTTEGKVYPPNGIVDDSDSSIMLSTILQGLKTNGAFTSDFLNSNETISRIYDDKTQNRKLIVALTPMSIQTQNDSILIAVTSFQSIEEASSIIGDFYKYVFVAMIFIGFILSIIYSNLISKPLVRLNNIAYKMSSMDFTEKCPVDREDEIGSLATTLNFLSENLSNALSDLRNKNRKLQADIEKERKLEKIRKDFIAGVSHELKTPIGIIEGYAEGLKDNIAEGEARDIYLDIIIDESNKMNKLVMDMLELSKLESDTNRLQIAPFDLIELTESILFKYSNNFSEKSLTVNKSYSTDNKVMVVGEAFKIESVITNFVTNAIKYTKENENINIFIGVDNKKALFSIENTGDFLEKDDLEKIWLQFYRVDKARSRAEGSSGLGLAIVKQMLTQHDSTFGVKNTTKGIEFFFDLALADS